MGIRERWYRFKPLPPDIMERIATLPAILERQRVRLSYLFGSLAAGKAGQDVDLALLVESGDLGALRQMIVEIIGSHRLDLVDLRTASPVLRFEIIRSGRVIYKQDDQTENDFEMAVLREYHDTAYLRSRQAEMLRERTAWWLSSGR